MKKMKIGLVDLDTSHPSAWLPILRELGHSIVGVFDGGSVYPQGYAESFATQHNAGKVFTSLEAMAGEVDLAIVFSCNWDLHVKRAKPFIDAGKAIFIDKPLAGNVQDLLQMLEWERQGARITGGSSLRYCAEVRKLAEKHEGRLNPMLTVVGYAADDFNYGVHTYSLLHGLLGPGMDHVRCVGVDGHYVVEMAWKDNRRGIVNIGTGKRYFFYATIVTETGISHLMVDNNQLYGSMLRQVLPYLAGEAEVPVPLSELMEVELTAIASLKSWNNGGERIYLETSLLSDTRYDGNQFEASYKLQKMESSLRG